MAAPNKKIAMTVDWPLLGVTFFLCVIGILNLASAGTGMLNGSLYWHRQLLNMVIGLGLMALIASVDYRIFERVAYPIFAGALFLLLITIVTGTLISGSRSWLRVGTFSIQPSEFMKIATIFALAKYYHSQRVGGPYGLKQLTWPVLIALLPAGLIMLQPDFGTTVMLLFIVGGIMLFVGVRRRIVTVCVSILLVAAPFSWFIMKPHQKARIKAFINPEVDPGGIGYNVIQSMVAVGSGKIAGKGYRLGTQTALKYLPERHTDFVFSVLGEEWGFIGCLIVLLCYLFILLWGLKIAANAKDRFGALVALGVVLMIFCHTVINVAMTLGAFPVVGIPLPFMSYGGSFLISTLVGIGLLMSIEERRFMF